MSLSFQPAQPSEIDFIFDCIHLLAEEEKFPGKLDVQKDDLNKAIFSEIPSAFALIAHNEKTPVAFALYYFTFSTTTGKKGLHLDDLYVLQNYRGKGLGKKMLQELAKVAKTQDCARFEWWALKWNENAISFYDRLGAEQMNDLQIFRASGEVLNRLASTS